MLRNRSLLGLITAELVSLTGSAMTYVALPWFVLATTGSTAKMGWVLAAELLPVGLFGIPSGALVARLGAKRTMLVADAARAPLLCAVPVLHWTGSLTFAALLAVSFAAGCFTAPYFSSSRLVVPEVVGEDERLVTRAGAILSGATQVTQIAGPVLAGVLMAATDPAAVLVVDAATYAFSFLVIATVVRAGRRVAPTEESRGLLAGLRFLMHDRLLGPTLVAACVLNLVVQGLIIALQWLVFDRYDESTHVLGWVFAAFGIGAFLGAVVAQSLAQKVDLLKLAATAIALMPVPVWLLAITMPWAGACVAVAGFGFFTPLVNAPLIGVLTVRTPEALRPKVMTSVMTVASLAGPIGFVAAGQALQRFSLLQVFVAIGAGLTVSGLAFAAAIVRGRATPAPVLS